jgi:hypothetical protein
MSDHTEQIAEVCLTAILAINDLRQYSLLCERGFDVKEHDRVTSRLVNILVEHRIFEAKHTITWDESSEIYAFADSQKNQGNPLLYEMLILKLYSLFESAIDDVVLECVKNRDVNFDILDRIKVSVRDAYSDRKDYAVLEAIKRDLANRERGPLSRLESMLALVNCSLIFPKGIKDGLHDFVCNRNLIAHKNSTVDPWFKNRCGYVAREIGERIPYDVRHFLYYSLCATCLLTLVARAKHAASNRQDIVEMSDELLGHATHLAASLYPCKLAAT